MSNDDWSHDNSTPTADSQLFKLSWTIQHSELVFIWNRVYLLHIHTHEKIKTILNHNFITILLNYTLSVEVHLQEKLFYGITAI